MKPYLKMKPSLSAGALLEYIGRKLEGDLKRPVRDIHPSLSLWCHGTLIGPGMTIEEMHRDVGQDQGARREDDGDRVPRRRQGRGGGQPSELLVTAAPPPASKAAETAAERARGGAGKRERDAGVGM